MKKNKILFIVNIIIFLFLLFGSIFIGYKLINTGIIPNKYIVILLVLITVPNILTGITLIVRNKIFSIIMMIISILILIFYLFVSKYFVSFTLFVQNTADSNKQSTYYFVVQKEDSDNIKDYRYEKIGMESHDKINTISFLQVIGLKDLKEQYLAYGQMANSLKNNKVRGIVVNENGLNIIKENKDIVFGNNFKIIKQKKLKINDSFKGKSLDVTGEPFIVYISGIDTYGDINTVSRSDVNILAVINAKTQKILFIHIPRDMKMIFSGTNTYDKLTHSGIYGPRVSVNSIEDFLDIDINYYVKVNFSTVERIVDLLGGITVDSKYAFHSYGTKFTSGKIRLNGKRALIYARERMTLKEGDISRGEHQLDVIEGMVLEMIKPDNLLNVDQLLNSMENTFETNLGEKEITSLVKHQLNTNINWQFENFNIRNSKFEYEKTYTYPEEELYVMYPKEEDLKEARQKISEYLK